MPINEKDSTAVRIIKTFLILTICLLSIMNQYIKLKTRKSTLLQIHENSDSYTSKLETVLISWTNLLIMNIIILFKRKN